jgi:hypothetical protein
MQSLHTLHNNNRDIKLVATWKAEIRQTVHETLTRKYPTQKKGWWSGSSVRAPAYQPEALSSKPSTTKKKLNKNNQNRDMAVLSHASF